MLVPNKDGSYSKPGKYGTLYLHRIEYCDVYDKHLSFTQLIWAYDFEHAIDKFYSEGDSDGWEVSKISRAKALRHRETVHDVSGSREGSVA